MWHRGIILQRRNSITLAETCLNKRIDSLSSEHCADRGRGFNLLVNGRYEEMAMDRREHMRVLFFVVVRQLFSVEARFLTCVVYVPCVPM